MDNEKLYGIELNDKELEQVTGGNNGKRICPVYQWKGQYKSCPVPDMGLYKQCSGCELNVV